MVSFFIYITEDKVESLGDPLVSAVFPGFFIGIGCGLIFRTGSSMGGSSLIAIMFIKLFDWELVRAMFIMDVTILLSCFTIIGPLYIMYTIITLFVAKKATALILGGLDTRTAVNIITSQAPVIADTIINQMNISVNVFKGYGGY